MIAPRPVGKPCASTVRSASTTTSPGSDLLSRAPRLAHIPNCSYPGIGEKCGGYAWGGDRPGGRRRAGPGPADGSRAAVGLAGGRLAVAALDRAPAVRLLRGRRAAARPALGGVRRNAALPPGRAPLRVPRARPSGHDPPLRPRARRARGDRPVRRTARVAALLGLLHEPLGLA